MPKRDFLGSEPNSSLVYIITWKGHGYDCSNEITWWIPLLLVFYICFILFQSVHWLLIILFWIHAIIAFYHLKGSLFFNILFDRLNHILIRLMVLCLLMFVLILHFYFHEQVTPLGCKLLQLQSQTYHAQQLVFSWKYEPWWWISGYFLNRALPFIPRFWRTLSVTVCFIYWWDYELPQ